MPEGAGRHRRRPPDRRDDLSVRGATGEPRGRRSERRARVAENDVAPLLLHRYLHRAERVGFSGSKVRHARSRASVVPGVPGWVKAPMQDRWRGRPLGRQPPAAHRRTPSMPPAPMSRAPGEERRRRGAELPRESRGNALRGDARRGSARHAGTLLCRGRRRWCAAHGPPPPASAPVDAHAATARRRFQSPPDRTRGRRPVLRQSD